MASVVLISLLLRRYRVAQITAEAALAALFHLVALRSLVLDPLKWFT